ncbi:dihydroneopterin aldolase [Mesonia sp. K7]|uniref:dihydroneopterin aldolase n=1 Tax=Mesonia sp. K7 TaxID=2218606 RepID=UPI000DAA510D|nr:dihydroneopterin aldolase [Mesonia sp. K7]PZD79139.1 dihydroneopterin aldolase [Mesonia sp. K7]
MGSIKLENIRVFTNHGCLTEEGKIGSEYRVDLTINANLSKSALSDQLEDTVDYVYLNQVVKEEMAVRSKLLEHVANRILSRIFEESPMVTFAEVVVSKINPPLGGDVEMVSILLSKQR